MAGHWEQPRQPRRDGVQTWTELQGVQRFTQGCPGLRVRTREPQIWVLFGLQKKSSKSKRSSNLSHLSHSHFQKWETNRTQLMHAPNWGSKHTWSTLGNFCFPCETGLQISNIVQFELLRLRETRDTRVWTAHFKRVCLVGGNAMMMVVRLFCWPPKASWALKV